MDQERVAFGSELKREREVRALTIGAIASMTKIPPRALERLEAGRFEELPAEVFVRGFVRSYARCVGLDAEEAVRRYGALILHTDGTDRESIAATASTPGEAPSVPPSATHEVGLVAKALAEAGRDTYRGSLTVAVIVLVIVATLTLSLFLKNPGYIGDGVSRGTGVVEIVS